MPTDRQHLNEIRRKAGVRRHRSRRLPKQLWPQRLEQEYAEELAKLTGRLVRSSLAGLLHQAPAILAAAAKIRTDSEETRRLFAGFEVVVENPVGSTRRWREGDRLGYTTMLNDYGFIAGFKGADDDDVDVYLGPDEESLWVTVIHQLKRSEALLWNEYDEDKVMLGFESADAAKAAYLAHYDDERYFGSMSVFRLPDFREKLHRVQGEAITCRMDSGGAKKIKQLIERGKSVLKKSAITEKVGQVGKKFGERTSSFQKSQLNKQHQAQFGIDVKLVDKKLKKRLAEFAAENARLISKMQTNAHNQIEKIVVKAMVEGDLWEDVADKIEERFEVSESHAKLIARDQIGKLYGQVNADRQQELGVKKFIWRSLKDERVRDEHDEREKESDPAQGGTPYSYDDPPDDELPGEPIQCRCYAEPVFSSIGDSEDD